MEVFKNKYANLDYQVNYDDIDEDTEVLIDQYMFEKILVNLIDNAMKYGSDDKISITKTGNIIYFKNKISTYLQNENIFETKTRRHSLNGNGLGVEIIKTYINLLGWSISSNTIENEFVVRIQMK